MEKTFAKLKFNIYFRLLLMIATILACFVLAIVTYAVWDKYWLMAIFLGIAPIFCVMYSYIGRKQYRRLDQEICIEAGKVFESMGLTFSNRGPVDQDMVSKIETEEPIKTIKAEGIIEGVYDDLEIKAFSFRFYYNVSQKGTFYGRIYRFTSKKNIKKIKLENIKSPFLANANKGHDVIVDGNVLYFYYINDVKDLRNYTTSPINFDSYEDFQNRMQEEIEIFKQVACII